MSLTPQMPPSNVPLMASDGSLHPAYRSFFTALLNRVGGVLGGIQPADPTLDALAVLNASPGVVVQTGPDTFTKVAGVTGTKTPPASLTVNNGVITGWS